MPVYQNLVVFKRALTSSFSKSEKFNENPHDCFDVSAGNKDQDFRHLNV